MREFVPAQTKDECNTSPRLTYSKAVGIINLYQISDAMLLNYDPHFLIHQEIYNLPT